MSNTVRNTQQSYKSWTVQIFRDEDCKVFAGTGFHLSKDHILTCEHVVKNTDQNGERWWVKSPMSKESIELHKLHDDSALDVAVAKLTRDVSIDSGAPLVEGVDERIIEDLLSENCLCYGCNPLGPFKLGKIIACDNANLQFFGSPKVGYSGCPVLLSEYLDYGVLGMAFLGRIESVQSRIVRSDAIIHWLNCLGDAKLKPRTVSIDEVLRRIAFGDRDWSHVVRDQWLDKWGYARNKQGVYVGLDGETTLQDSQGRPIVVFNEETRSTIRDKGLNTGSIEYAKLYDKNPDRFGGSEMDEEIVQETRERMGIEDRS